MIYYCEKLSTNAQMTLLGYEQYGQEGINFSFTLDGTKDSCRTMVFSYNKKETIKPFSVILHKETMSWWVVSKDKVERYENESGYLYKHSLQLLGAIEILNARDLTNCGFNQNQYNILNYLQRLISLSSFEFKDTNIVENTNIDLYQFVDYVKTFENYTLLSAMREFMDGYNCSLKLTFSINSSNQITNANLHIIPKHGDKTLNVLEMNNFNNIQELRNINKSSYGNNVVSNVDNAVSSIVKDFPNVGGVKLCSSSYNTTPDNAIIKLPSNAFYVEQVDMCMAIRLSIQLHVIDPLGENYWSAQTYMTNYYNVANNLKPLLDEAKNYIINNYSTNFDSDDFESKRNEMYSIIYNGATVEFKQGVIYDAINQSYSYKDDSYSIKKMHLYHNQSQFYEGKVVLMDKDTANGTHNPWNCIKWERGSDEISGFGWISYDKNSTSEPASGGACYVPFTETISGVSLPVVYEYNYTQSAPFQVDKARIIIEYVSNAGLPGTAVNCVYVDNFYHRTSGDSIHKALFKVKYIPMTDLKVKLENREKNNNTHLYNQNGKLTDLVAFSKLLNSYKEEIESENITKYASGCETFTIGTTTFNDISLPKLGQIVNDTNGETFVINNVSFNLYLNEPNEYLDSSIEKCDYFITAEYTLSKNVATKSLMVNPNTNIRDYGIPQKNNVKRIDIDRDIWELDHSVKSNILRTLPINKILNISNYPQPYVQHTAIIRLKYNTLINNQNTYYYQLEATTYMLKKAIFEVVEFKDNNIIGYDCQNTFSGFDIQRILGGMYDLINTPISYVDENGQFKDIDLIMCNSEQMSEIYNDYMEDNSITTDLPLQDMMLFIPSGIYNFAVDNKDYSLTYENYDKDALEIPVFEYCSQINDSNDVSIGDNILVNNNDDFFYLYTFSLETKGTTNVNNWTSLSGHNVAISINEQLQTLLYTQTPADMEYGTNEIKIGLRDTMSYNTETNTLSKGTLSNPITMGIMSKDLVIIRHTFVKEYGTQTYTSINNQFYEIHGDNFTLQENEYVYEEYMDILNDTIDLSTMQVFNIRKGGTLDVDSIIVSITIDTINRRFKLRCSTQTPPDRDKYLNVIFDYSYDYTGVNYAIKGKDLMFIVRHTENATITDNKVILKINNYK